MDAEQAIDLAKMFVRETLAHQGFEIDSPAAD